MTTETKQKYAVLLVDDDQFLLDMYSLKFSKEGHDVQTCLSIEDAIRVLEAGSTPDAIVFDLVMPKGDGHELIAAVKEKGLAPNAILVALTNQSTEQEKRETKAAGADEYIVKAATVPSDVVNIIVQAITAHNKA